jgi:predicted dehydrogenase
VPEYQGGFLLDGGVHFVAGVRALLAPLDEKIVRLSAFTTLLRPQLPPVDTVHAILKTASGNSGTLCISFGAQYKSGLEFEVVTENGSVKMTPGDVQVVSSSGGEKSETKKDFKFNAAVLPEIEAFAKSLQANVRDERQSPEESLADLVILQRMLESGEEEGQVLSV